MENKMDKNGCITEKGKAPTVFIIGDSTVRNHAQTSVSRFGWGQKLGDFLTAEVKVINEAMPGRSTRSFIDEGRFAPVEAGMKPGDYLFIQFGHNDQKPDEARRTEPFTTYKTNLKYYIHAARSKGACPVLVTSVHRRHFDEAGYLKDTHGEYLTAMREVAVEEKTVLIDLAAKTWELYQSLGDEGSRKLFFWLEPGENPDYPEGIQDNSHFNEYGAGVIAGLVAAGIRETGMGLTEYLDD